MGLKLITSPADPVSLAEVKADLRIDHTDHDALLTRHIKEAAQRIDGPRTWFVRSLMPQTWELSLDEFPAGEIRLPTAPVRSISSVIYDDPEGVAQTVDDDDYHLDDTQEPAWLVPVPSGWGVSTLSAVNVVRVRFVSGYADADAVPGPIKSAIRLMVREAYEGADFSKPIADLLGPWRIYL